MATLEPFTAALFGSILWVILVIIAVVLSFCKDKFKIDEKIVMFSWDLVKIFGGALFTFIFGGGT